MVRTTKVWILFLTVAITIGCSMGVYADNILLDKENNIVYYLYEPVDPELEEKYEAIPKFSDVDPGADYHEAILSLIQYGIADPTEDPRFYPDREITQREITEMLAFFAAGQTAENALRWCEKQKILPRDMAENFSPNQAITREEAAYIFEGLAFYENSRFLEEIQKQMTAKPKSFADSDEISNWATTAVNRMNLIGLFSTEEANTFHPQRAVTRSEFAKTLYFYFMLDRRPTFDNGKTAPVEYIGEETMGIKDFNGNSIPPQRKDSPKRAPEKSDVTRQLLLIAGILCGLCVIGGGAYVARRK